jgi:hypothetical protein
MKEIKVKTKSIKELEFMQQHTLTREDTNKLIRDKFERARAYSEAWQKRDVLSAESR